MNIKVGQDGHPDQEFVFKYRDEHGQFPEGTNYSPYRFPQVQFVGGPKGTVKGKKAKPVQEPDKPEGGPAVMSSHEHQEFHGNE